MPQRCLTDVSRSRPEDRYFTCAAVAADVAPMQTRSGHRFSVWSRRRRTRRRGAPNSMGDGWRYRQEVPQAMQPTHARFGATCTHVYSHDLQCARTYTHSTLRCTIRAAGGWQGRRVALSPGKVPQAMQPTRARFGATCTHVYSHDLQCARTYTHSTLRCTIRAAGGWQGRRVALSPGK